MNQAMNIIIPVHKSIIKHISNIRDDIRTEVCNKRGEKRWTLRTNGKGEIYNEEDPALLMMSYWMMEELDIIVKSEKDNKWWVERSHKVGFYLRNEYLGKPSLFSNSTNPEGKIS